MWDNFKYWVRDRVGYIADEMPLAGIVFTALVAAAVVGLVLAPFTASQANASTSTVPAEELTEPAAETFQQAYVAAGCGNAGDAATLAGRIQRGLHSDYFSDIQCWPAGPFPVTAEDRSQYPLIDRFVGKDGQDWGVYRVPDRDNNLGWVFVIFAR